MTQEEKQLLLKDLCARLPYNVKIKFAFNKDIEKINNIIYVSDNEPSYIHNSCMVLTEDNIKYVFNDWFDEYKPYLRPMSSMADGEKEELTEEHKKDERIYIDVIERVANGDEHARGTAIPHFAADWCNERHFDYRGLIEKGLAIAVTENNNPYEN